MIAQGRGRRSRDRRCRRHRQDMRGPGRRRPGCCVPRGPGRAGDRGDPKPVSDPHGSVKPVQQSVPVVHPGELVKIETDGVEPDLRCPAQFPFDGSRVETVWMPHLEKIDGARRQEIEAADPWPGRPPSIRLGFGPAGHGSRLLAEVRPTQKAEPIGVSGLANPGPRHRHRQARR